MLTIIISVLFGALIGVLIRVSGLVHSTGAAVAPGIFAMLGAAIFIFRRVSKQLTPQVEEAQKHLQAGRREQALKGLRGALRWNRWHPLLGPQLHTQIGAIQYATGEWQEAIEHLSKGSKKPWEARAFLGCAYYKAKNDAGMKAAFDDAIKVAEKEGLAYTIYAYCLLARDKRDEAVAVLKKGLEKNPTDQRLKTNLELAETGKKLKVAPYAERWGAFQLDGAVTTPQNVPKAFRGYAQRPGFRQRPQRR